MTMSAPTLEKILQAVNEKYGTSFEGWSQLPTVYEVGDTVPNWNAYEKIEGGGDTPLQDTRFAIEFEAGKFAFGHGDEDEIFVATRDGLAQIWYANANGVITGYTPNADNVASAIIDAFNEHFGTDINIWTPDEDEVVYNEGDEINDWNSYIKIRY